MGLVFPGNDEADVKSVDTSKSIKKLASKGNKQYNCLVLGNLNERPFSLSLVLLQVE